MTNVGRLKSRLLFLMKNKRPSLIIIRKRNQRVGFDHEIRVLNIFPAQNYIRSGHHKGSSF